MYKAIFLAVVLHTLPELAIAAPPIEGFPTLEERVARGCRDADTVVVAQVVNLHVKRAPGVEVKTGDVKVLRTLKGDPKNVPGSVSRSIPVPLTTDAFPVFLENNTPYVMFFRGRLGLAAGSEILPPHRNIPETFEAIISLAESACAITQP